METKAKEPIKPATTPPEPLNNCRLYTWHKKWFSYVVERNYLPSGFCETVCRIPKIDGAESIAIGITTYLSELENKRSEAKKPTRLAYEREGTMEIISSLRIVNNKTDKEYVVEDGKDFGLIYKYTKEFGKPSLLLIGKRDFLMSDDFEPTSVYQDFSIREIIKKEIAITLEYDAVP